MTKARAREPLNNGTVGGGNPSRWLRRAEHQLFLRDRGPGLPTLTSGSRFGPEIRYDYATNPNFSVQRHYQKN